MAQLRYTMNWIPDAKAQREQVASEGLASRPSESTDQQPGFYDKMFDAMSSYFEGDEEEARSVLKPETPSATTASRDADLDATLEELARASANVHRDLDKQLGNVDARGSTGDLITKDIEIRKEEDKDVKTTTTNDAEPVGGIMSNSKDGQEAAPVTAAPGLMSPIDPTVKEAVTEAKDIVQDEIGISADLWDAYREEVSAIESGAEEDPYAAKGGANDHYDGMYQLGKVAKQDAAQLLGITLGHTAQAREAYRNDPALQEKAFAAYTAKNHTYLTNKSEKYRNLPLKEKLAVLGYAHNQGWSGANKWLNTGVEGKDAFGTKGTKYYDAITKRLSE